MSNRRAFDTIGQALSGLMWAAGSREQKEPFQTIGAPCDQIGATVLAYSILAGLVCRELQGIGQQIEVSLLGSAVHLQALGLNMTLMRHRAYSRHSRERARNPMANFYCCADGKWIVLAEPQSDRFWGEFCRVMGLDHMEHDPRFASALARRDNHADCNAAVAQVFGSRPRSEWIGIFEERNAEFAYAPIYDYYDVANEAQVRENGYIVSFDHPVLGKTETVGSPVKFTKTPAGIQREAPELGQHTEEVLIDILGVSWDEIAQLKEQGAIG